MYRPEDDSASFPLESVLARFGDEADGDARYAVQDGDYGQPNDGEAAVAYYYENKNQGVGAEYYRAPARSHLKQGVRHMPYA